MQKRQYKTVSRGGNKPEDIAKIKKDPVKYFEFLYPNLKLSDEQKQAIKTLATEPRNNLIARTQSPNTFVQFVARFVASNY
jgi:hypothetical protein